MKQIVQVKISGTFYPFVGMSKTKIGVVLYDDNGTVKEISLLHVQELITQ